MNNNYHTQIDPQQTQWQLAKQLHDQQLAHQANKNKMFISDHKQDSEIELSDVEDEPVQQPTQQPLQQSEANTINARIQNIVSKQQSNVQQTVPQQTNVQQTIPQQQAVQQQKVQQSVPQQQIQSKPKQQNTAQQNQQQKTPEETKSNKKGIILDYILIPILIIVLIVAMFHPKVSQYFDKYLPDSASFKGIITRAGIVAIVYIVVRLIGGFCM